MYQLYTMPGACSMAVHAILHEINVPFEVHTMDRTSIKSEDFLKINPRGNVPVLTDDGFVIREGAAIISWLCDKHGFPHWPQISVGSGHGRAAALQWLAYMNSTLHTAYSKLFWLLGNNADQSLITTAAQQIQTLWDEINQQLRSTTFLCGEQPSPADFLMAVIANWAPAFNLPHQPILGDNVQKALAAITSRDSFQKALLHEKVEYKAAA